MVGAVEAVAMTTMAAAPEMAMAVVTVTRAVAASPIRLAAGSAAWAGQSEAPLPRSREATLLVTRSPAQVAEPPVAAAGAVGWIEEWPAADTENEDNPNKCHAVRVHCKVKCVEQHLEGGNKVDPIAMSNSVEYEACPVVHCLSSHFHL